MAAPPTVSPAHAHHSLPFAGAPLNHFTPPAVTPPSPLPVTPEQLQHMIAQQVQALAFNPAAQTSHCHPHGASGQVCADNGKLKTITVNNPDMAARFGVFAQPTFEIDGEVDSGDISKMKKVLTAGHDKVGAGMVYRQALWPHKMLMASVPGYDTIAHKDLTFHHLMNGMVSKCLAETPAEKLDLELSNKLSFLQFLIEMAFHYDHKHVIETYQLVHQAWQMRTFEWSHSWSSIEDRLKNIRSNFQRAPNPVAAKQSAKCLSCAAKNPALGYSSTGAGGNPNRQPPPSDVNGVPTAYMKAQNICIKFNKPKGCQENPHKVGQNKDVTLRHICAGCHKKSNSQETHPCHNCGNGPFKALFRGW